MKGETWNMEDLKDLAPSNFLRTALSIMAYQASNNAVYNEWIRSMKVQLDRVECLEQIPFYRFIFIKLLLFIQELNAQNFILKVVVPRRIL
jgi:hypothetical protein